ncbi:MAG TPA: hypothetical protein VK750_04115 [Cytophagaceae bacterium]|jgi:hypothetical protein|nr:hypothetical protein [Cytophagaceae bacterium]
MLHIKDERIYLKVIAYTLLAVFLFQKTIVPLLHDHHAASPRTQTSASISHSSNDCFACDIEKASLPIDTQIAIAFTDFLVCLGILQLFTLFLKQAIQVIFSSLRAPPVSSLL